VPREIFEKKLLKLNFSVLSVAKKSLARDHINFSEVNL